MKNLSSITLSTLVLVLVIAVPMQAQSGNPSGAIRVNIPFQFNVGSERFPAGDYLVAPLFDNSIKIASVDGRGATVVLTSWTGGGLKTQGPKLVFHKYGERRFLSQLWLHRSDTGRQVFASAEEIELARMVPQESTIIMADK
jgi:hypothetical protein